MSLSYRQNDIYLEFQRLKDRLSSLEGSSLPVEGTRLVGSDGNPPFVNSWVNYDPSRNSAGFFRDYRSSMVFLTGIIKSGSANNAAFVLPVGYRPAKRTLFIALTYNDTFCRVHVESDGSVVPSTGASSTWVNLDGLCFRV